MFLIEYRVNDCASDDKFVSICFITQSENAFFRTLTPFFESMKKVNSDIWNTSKLMLKMIRIKNRIISIR